MKCPHTKRYCENDDNSCAWCDAEPMTWDKYDEYVRSVHQDLINDGILDGHYDIADSILLSGPEIGEFLRSEGVIDVRGRLANDIYAGRGK